MEKNISITFKFGDNDVEVWWNRMKQEDAKRLKEKLNEVITNFKWNN